VTSLCEAVRGALLDRICHQGPIELSESNERSRGAPVRLLGQTSFWAAGKIDYPRTYDKPSAMNVYEIPPGGEIHLESFF
jgi:hypothetical protein